MRHPKILPALMVSAALLGCGTDESDGPGFSIRTADFRVAPGVEKIVCHRFETPNAAEMAIKRWTSTISANVVSARLFLDSTSSQSGCGFGDGSLTHIAYRSSDELAFPANDGMGRPVAQILKARQRGFVVLHLTNPTSDTIVMHARFEATGYPDGTAVTRADPLVTYQAQISIPTSTSHIEAAACDTPADATFFAFTTFTFRLSTQTSIRDGSTGVFAGTNFADPGALVLHAPPYFTFATGRLTYQCDYANPGNNTIISGDNPATNEQCVALTWHFPSTGPRLCLDNQLLP
jgi:hypothetical protein